jgi:hypothetical protein
MGRPITEEYVQKCVERDRKTQKDTYLDACQRAQLGVNAEAGGTLISQSLLM